MPSEGEEYDVGNDINGVFSEEFKKYAREENLSCRSSTYEDADFCFFEKENEHNGFTSVYHHLALSYGYFFSHDVCMVQFWRVEELVNCDGNIDERRFLLTTRNQPFLISKLYTYQAREGLCRYRMNTRAVIITGEGRSGVIDRVFKSKRMEFTPYVAYYSSQKYPHRDMALSCQIECSLVVALCNSSGYVVAMIEFVSAGVTWDLSLEFIIIQLLSIEPENGLKWFDSCKDLCGQYVSSSDCLHKAVSEINKVMKVVRKRLKPGGVVCAQTWLLCKIFNSLSTTERLDDRLGVSYLDYFSRAESTCVLQMSEGIVGKAAESSHNLVYCENIANFSIIEYPLAHLARIYNLSACFAICLQSKHSGDQAYVLEFFLSPSYVKGKNFRAVLVPILDAMRQSFRTFKVASGIELMDGLSVRVIDANFPDKFETLENGVGNVNDFNLLETLEENEESSSGETDDWMIEDFGVETSSQDMEYASVVSASTVESGMHVTIEANYGVTLIVFPFYASSGIHELYDQVSRRLELDIGAYDLRYPDEDNDLILLTCDEDLHDIISCSTKEENYTLKVFVVPN